MVNLVLKQEKERIAQIANCTAFRIRHPLMLMIIHTLVKTIATKMKKVFFLLLLTPFVISAQGIRFENGNWKALLAKAKAENKLLFVDAFTTWLSLIHISEPTRPY